MRAPIRAVRPTPPHGNARLTRFEGPCTTHWQADSIARITLVATHILGMLNRACQPHAPPLHERQLAARSTDANRDKNTSQQFLSLTKPLLYGSPYGRTKLKETWLRHALDPSRDTQRVAPEGYYRLPF